MGEIMAIQTSRLVIEINANQASTTLKQLSQELGGLTKNGEIASDKIGQLGKDANGQTGKIDAMARSVKQLAASYVSFQLVQNAIARADTFTGMQNGLKLVTKSTAELNAATEATYQIAQRTRGSWEGTVQVYSKFAQNADKLGISMNDVGRVTETVNKAIAMSGASAGAAQAAMFQFGQALASGVLRGDEFNSMAEQTPAVMDAMAKGLGVSRGELRAMAADGKLTAETVTKALLSVSQSVDADFSKTSATVGQSMQMLNDSLTKFIGDADKAVGASRALADGIKLLADNMDTVATAGMAGAVAMLIPRLGSVVAAANAATVSLTAMRAAALAFMATPAGLAVAAIGAVVAFDALTTSNEELRESLNKTVPTAKEIVDSFGKLNKDGQARYLKELNGQIEELQEQLDTAKKRMDGWSHIPGMEKVIKQFIDGKIELEDLNAEMMNHTQASEDTRANVMKSAEAYDRGRQNVEKLTTSQKYLNGEIKELPKAANEAGNGIQGLGNKLDDYAAKAKKAQEETQKLFDRWKQQDAENARTLELMKQGMEESVAKRVAQAEQAAGGAGTWAGMAARGDARTSAEAALKVEREMTAFKAKQAEYEKSIAKSTKSRIAGSSRGKSAGDLLAGNTAAYVIKNAADRYLGQCAEFVNNALQAQGLKVYGHGKDVARNAIKTGKYHEVKYGKDYIPQIGDVMSMQSYTAKGKKYGHVAMYTQKGWVSDKVQGNQFGNVGATSAFQAKQIKSGNAFVQIARPNGTTTDNTVFNNAYGKILDEQAEKQRRLNEKYNDFIQARKQSIVALGVESETEKLLISMRYGAYADMSQQQRDGLVNAQRELEIAEERFELLQLADSRKRDFSGQQFELSLIGQTADEVERLTLARKYDQMIANAKREGKSDVYIKGLEAEKVAAEEQRKSIEGQAAYQQFVNRLVGNDELQEYAQNVGMLKRAMEDGYISAEKYRLSVMQLGIPDALKTPDDWLGGLKYGIESQVLTTQSLFDRMSDFGAQTFEQMGDSLANFVATGKMDFRGLTVSILQDLSKMLIKMAVMRALQAAMGMFGGGGFNVTGQMAGNVALGGGSAAGGYTGLFAGFSGGGYTGIGGKYEPAGIVHRGEVVFSQQDVARHGGVGAVERLRLKGYADGGVVGFRPPKASSGGEITVNMTVNVDGGGGNTQEQVAAGVEAGMAAAMKQIATEEIAKSWRPGNISYSMAKSV